MVALSLLAYILQAIWSWQLMWWSEAMFTLTPCPLHSHPGYTKEGATLFASSSRRNIIQSNKSIGDNSLYATIPILGHTLTRATLHMSCSLTIHQGRNMSICGHPELDVNRVSRDPKKTLKKAGGTDHASDLRDTLGLISKCPL